MDDRQGGPREEKTIMELLNEGGIREATPEEYAQETGVTTSYFSLSPSAQPRKSLLQRLIGHKPRGLCPKRPIGREASSE